MLLRKPDAHPQLCLWIAKDGNKHSIQKQGWSPGEKAKEPQVGGRAAGSQGMPEDYDAQDSARTQRPVT